MSSFRSPSSSSSSSSMLSSPSSSTLPKYAKPTIRVIARVRPSLNPKSTLCTTYHPQQSDQIIITQTEKNNLRRGEKKGDPPKITTYESKQLYTFDQIYYTNIDTIEIYNKEVESLITKVLNGGASCILAYGQTGSGKTHTISGNNNSPGIIHTVAVDLMDGIAVLNDIIRTQSSSKATLSSLSLPPTLPNNQPIPTKLLNTMNQEIQVYVTAGEVYQETLLDLGVTLKEKPKRLTPLTLRRQLITNAEELMAYLSTCIERQAQGATNKNEQSSRSHAVYLITLEYNTKPNIPIGLLGLIDLAGAEYATATEGRENIRRMEGGKNNLGLMALKNLFRYIGQLDNLTNNIDNNHQQQITNLQQSHALQSLPIFSWHRSTLTKILKPFLSGSIDILINQAKQYHQQTKQSQNQQSNTANNEEDNDSVSSDEDNIPINSSSLSSSSYSSSSLPLFTTQNILLCVTVSPENQDAYQTSTALTDGLALMGRLPPIKEITDIGLLHEQQQLLLQQQQGRNYIYSHRNKNNNQTNNNNNKILQRPATVDSSLSGSPRLYTEPSLGIHPNPYTQIHVKSSQPQQQQSLYQPQQQRPLSIPSSQQLSMNKLAIPKVPISSINNKSSNTSSIIPTSVSSTSTSSSSVSVIDKLNNHNINNNIRSNGKTFLKAGSGRAGGKIGYTKPLDSST